MDENPDDGSWLVEEYLDRGIEITVLGATHNGIYRNLFVTSKTISNEAPMFAEIMHRYPASIPQETYLEIQRIMQTIVDCAGLGTSPMVSEFLFRQNKLYLIEAAPEIGGEFLADHAFLASTGINYFDWLIRLLTEVSMPQVPTPERSAIVRFILPRAGIFLGLQFPAWLRELPGFLFERQLVVSGRATSLESGNLERLAAFGLTGPLNEIETIIASAERVAGETEIRYATR